MSMDYAACTGHCISYENLKKMLPNEIAAVESHPDFEDWSTVAQYNFDDEDQLDGTVTALCDAFQKATEVGEHSLTLSILMHDPDEGSRYDEVSREGSCVFEVSGLFQKTPAAKKFDDVLEEFSVVQFG